MSYRMTKISDRTRIGQRSNGDFDIETHTKDENGETVVESVFVPLWDAEDVAKYILRNS